METTVKIVIPTKGRASTITTHNFIDNAIVCVAQSEAREYKEYNPNAEFCIHPDNITGLPAKRQWIYDKFKNVFMADDDLKGMIRLTQKPGETQKMTSEQCYYIIQNAANVARLMGCYMFGFSNWPKPEHYQGHEPFSMNGFINGAGLGLLAGATKLKFNPAIIASQDYYITGLNAFHYRKAFIDRRYCMKQIGFGDNVGDMSGVRTNTAEAADYKLLKAYFGSAIELKKQGATQIKHAFSKTIKIPF